MPRRIVNLLATACIAAATATIVVAQTTVTMQYAALSFRLAPGGGDDAFQLRAVVTMPITSFAPSSEAFTLTISDSDDTIYSATVPPGSFTTHGPGRLRYFDRTGTIVSGLRKVAIRRDPSGGVKVRTVGHNLDLGNANRTDITTTFRFGQDAFQATNHFRVLRAEFRFP